MMRNVTCITTPVQRSKGHTAIGGAAYRAGENLKAIGVGKDGEDKWYRYSPKSVVVREAFILTPQGAPDEASDRAALWNRVEAMETHKKARLGRDINLGLAYELSHHEQRALIVEFATRELVDRGFVVDVSIHNYGRTLPSMGGSEEQRETIREWAKAGIPFLSREEAQGREDVHVMEMTGKRGEVTGFKLYQPHCHLRVTPRICVNGDFAKDKYASRELNRDEVAMSWRYEWPKLQNAYLERAGSEVRVRSTSDREDAYRDIRFKGEGDSAELRRIDERALELSDDQRERHDAAKQASADKAQRRSEHNQIIAETYDDLVSPSGSQSEQGQRQRQMRWWQIQAQRLVLLRDDISDAARLWHARVKVMAERFGLRWGLLPERNQHQNRMKDVNYDREQER